MEVSSPNRIEIRPRRFDSDNMHRRHRFASILSRGRTGAFASKGVEKRTHVSRSTNWTGVALDTFEAADREVRPASQSYFAYELLKP